VTGVDDAGGPGVQVDGHQLAGHELAVTGVLGQRRARGHGLLLQGEVGAASVAQRSDEYGGE
jgi:hypothetical protein